MPADLAGPSKLSFRIEKIWFYKQRLENSFLGLCLYKKRIIPHCFNTLSMFLREQTKKEEVYSAAPLFAGAEDT